MVGGHANRSGDASPGRWDHLGLADDAVGQLFFPVIAVKGAGTLTTSRLPHVGHSGLTSPMLGHGLDPLEGQHRTGCIDRRRSASNPPGLECHVTFSTAICLSGTARHDLAAALASELLDRTADAETADHLDQVEIVSARSGRAADRNTRSKRLRQILTHGAWSSEHMRRVSNLRRHP